jgi:hypothetical protein
VYPLYIEPDIKSYFAGGITTPAYRILEGAEKHLMFGYDGTIDNSASKRMLPGGRLEPSASATEGITMRKPGQLLGIGWTIRSNDISDGFVTLYMLKNGSTLSNLYADIRYDSGTHGYVEYSVEHANDQWTEGDRICVLVAINNLHTGTITDLDVVLDIRT